MGRSHDYFGLADFFFGSIFRNERSSAPGDSSAPTSAASFWKRSSCAAGFFAWTLSP
jgi:hypothetical protein